ncbi:MULTISPECIES: hypothetical protein [Parachlamydia]|nr:hypothetical protein [Parachlamydia acanthamoebae]EFB41457.1 hypothetical protein pah_c032o012 [Parachlamydia acanthamoebae str. Hall's coccus]
MERILFRSLAELKALQSARRCDQELEIGFVPQNCTEEPEEN